MNLRRCLLMLLLVFTSQTIFASDTNGMIGEVVPEEYPTVEALDSAIIPQRDSLALARRLWGITEFSAPPQNPPVRQVGERDFFWVSNAGQNRVVEIEAELIAVGRFVYVWVQTGSRRPPAQAEAFARVFDEEIYHQARELWGEESNPGIDGDPRVYAVFARGLSSGTLAYYSSQNSLPASIAPRSSEHDMLVFNLDVIWQMDDPEIFGTGAHEFQHMIRDHVDTNEDGWLDEGSSVFTEMVLGFDSSGFLLEAFRAAPDTQLNYWEGSAEDYGASALFISYFYQRYGASALTRLSAEPLDGLRGMDAVLKELGAPGVDSFFADWAVANYFQESSGLFSYPDFVPRGSARLNQTVRALPHQVSDTLPQYAADYYKLLGLSGTVNIAVDMPDTVSLLPTTPDQGSRFWYSNKADQSDTTLTRQFDLSGVSRATLNYRVWYDIEELWDYGYVLVSTDGGATWDILSTPQMNASNPNFTAFGAGYTGRSLRWLEESLSLDAYAGREVLIRFEMITDDATVEMGLALDDVSIPEIGYFSDFEADDGGWSSSGWILTDNRLPQRAWAQIAYRRDGAVQVERWLLPAGPRQITLPADEDVILIVAPFAPLTIIPLKYTLMIGSQ